MYRDSSAWDVWPLSPSEPSSRLRKRQIQCCVREGDAASTPARVSEKILTSKLKKKKAYKELPPAPRSLHGIKDYLYWKEISIKKTKKSLGSVPLPCQTYFIISLAQFLRASVKRFFWAHVNTSKGLEIDKLLKSLNRQVLPEDQIVPPSFVRLLPCSGKYLMIFVTSKIESGPFPKARYWDSQ